MWPFERPKEKKPVVVFHIDHNGLARGAYFRGDADVLVIDERDPKNRVYRMGQETPDDELRRKVGKHPLGGLLAEIEEEERAPSALPGDVKTWWRTLGGKTLGWRNWGWQNWRWQNWRWPGWASVATGRKVLKSARDALPFKAKSRAGA